MAKINDDGFLELSGINTNTFQDALNTEKFPLLAGMSPLNLRVLNQASRIMHVGSGVAMMCTGDAPHDLYFIAEGTVSIAKELSGKQTVIAQLQAGDFYGEYGALRGKTRFASVYSAEPSTIIRVDLKAIEQVMDVDEEFKQRISHVMKERLLNSFLCCHSAFRQITQHSRDLLAKQLTITELKRDEVLFAAGDIATNYYVILSGEAEVCVKSSEKEVVVDIRRDNDTLGEARSDQGAKYAYTVRTANNLDLLLLDKEATQLIHQLEPKVMAQLNTIMAAQVKKIVPLIQQVMRS